MRLGTPDFGGSSLGKYDSQVGRWAVLAVAQGPAMATVLRSFDTTWRALRECFGGAGG
jgi:hypothetical protein